MAPITMNPRRIWPRRSGWPTCLLLLFLWPTWLDAAPIDELLARVPPETGICLIVQNLREHGDQLVKSPFAEVLANSPLAEKLFPQKDRAKLAAFDALLRANLDTSFAEVRDDILGDAFVFAFRPAPLDRPDEEQGLILLRPRNPNRLGKLLERLNELQKASGEIRAVRTLSYRDFSYQVREKPEGAEYYLFHEGIFAFSGQESALRALIDQSILAARPEAPLPAVQQARQRLELESAFLVCWFHPRVFDSYLRPENSRDPREQAFLSQFRRLWQSCDSLAIYAHPRQNFEVGFAAAFQPQRMPAELKPLLLEPARPTRVATAIPEDSLVAAVGTIDLPAWLEALASFLPASDRDGIKQLLEDGLGPVIGRQRLPSLLQGIGPGWAAWVIPPPHDSVSGLPLAAVAVELSTSEPNISPAIGQALEVGFHFVRISYNRTHSDQIDLHDEADGANRVRFLRNDAGFPPGFQPAFAIKGNLVLLATHPDAIRGLQPPASHPDRLGLASPKLTTLDWRISATRILALLEQHHKSLAKVIAEWTECEKGAVTRELSIFHELLKLLKSIQLTSQTDRGRLRWRLQVEFSQPLQP